MKDLVSSFERFNDVFSALRRIGAAPVNFRLLSVSARESLRSGLMGTPFETEPPANGGTHVRAMITVTDVRHAAATWPRPPYPSPPALGREKWNKVGELGWWPEERRNAGVFCGLLGGRHP